MYNVKLPTSSLYKVLNMAEKRVKEEVTIALAKKLLRRGLTIEDISEDTELPIEKIKMLQVQYA